MNKELNIVHVALKSEDTNERKHFYFSNMQAIFYLFDREQIGIPYNTLRRKILNPSTGLLYDGEKCTIWKGKVITSPRTCGEGK